MELTVLGPVRLVIGGTAIRLSELERSLLAAAATRSWIGGDSLTEWLWGDDVPSTARNRVQALVSGLRRKGTAEVVVTVDGGYRLGDRVEVDLARWSAAVSAAREESDAGRRAALLDDASRWFDDEPLQGVPATGPVDAQRDLLLQERLAVLESRFEAHLAAGLLDGVATELASLTTEHPFHEGLLALHVLALGASGQQRRALEVYRAARRRLVDELGVEPSAPLREAHERVLRGDAGEARGESHEPARASLPVPQTLPRPPAGFVGRRQSLDAVAAAAESSRDAAAMVTVTGLTGSGTSAFAVTAATAVRHAFPDGVLYADVSDLRSDGSLHATVGTFLRLLGVSGEVVPDDPAARTGLYRSVIAERRLLVVLDDVDTADGAPHPRLGDLLPSTPGSMGMVTARATVEHLDPTLRVRLGSLDDDEALELLTTTIGAERVLAEPAAASELVRMTAGLPLTLRLVGSRLASRPEMRVASLVDRLAGSARSASDIDPAVRVSLHDSLTLVWERLPETTRHAARLLSVLPFEAFSPWVVAALLDDPFDGDEAVDALVDASFVEPVVRPGRLPQYRMHDVVARYARASADEHGLDRADTVRTVARSLLDLLQRHHGRTSQQLVPPPPRLPDDAPAGVAHQVDGDPALVMVTELAAAHACAATVAADDPSLAWRLANVCENTRQLAQDDEGWERALRVVDAALASRTDADADTRLGRAVLHTARAWHLQDNLGQAAPALEMAVRARCSLERLDVPRHHSTAALVAAYAALSIGDRDTAEHELALADEGLDAVRDAVLVGWGLVVRGELLNDYDELAECERTLEEARRVLAGTPDRIGWARATVYLSRACRRQGSLERAKSLADDALTVFRELDAQRSTTMALDARAEIGVELGEGEAALDQAGTALARASAARDAFIIARSIRTRARAMATLDRLEEAERELGRALDHFRLLDRPLSVAATWRDLADVRARRGDDAGAEQARAEQRAAEAGAAGVVGGLAGAGSLDAPVR